MNTLKFRLEGTSTLLLHNGELANPLNKFTRELNMRKKKGRGIKDEQTIMDDARLEFFGSLYLHPKTKKIGIPARIIFTVIRNGARAFKKGKTIEAGLVVQGFFPLEYNGPEDPDELFDLVDDLGLRPFVDQRMVGVQRSKVLRTRPRFDDWALEIEVSVDPSIVEPDEVLSFIADAGVRHGLGDGRSLGYGRFQVEAL